MGPGCRRRRFGAPGEPCPERQGDRKLSAPSPPETPSPGAAGSAGSGPGHGGGEAARPLGGTAEPRGELSWAGPAALRCGPSTPAPRLALTRGLASPGLPPIPRHPVGAPECKERGGLGRLMV